MPGRILEHLDRKRRLATSRDRALPDCIIIGAQKSGTTSLFHYLAQHPDILASHPKEVGYFDGSGNHLKDKFSFGEQWYRAHFPLKRRVKPGQRVFEASPLYLMYPPAARRMVELIPEVKLIAVLRNPTERAISHYFHERRAGRESLPIDNAIAAEDGRLKSAVESGNYRSNEFINCSYRGRGRYHEQLKRYLEYFPSQNLLILESEQLFADPGAHLKQVFDFVGVAADFKVRDLKPKNIASNRAVVDESLYRGLEDYFRPHNEALYELLGRRFSW